jgi:CspA family cold shock protein
VSERYTGTIKRLPVDADTGKRRGFGFIRDGRSGVEYFFHASSMEMTSVRFADLTEGQRVEFDVAEGPKGPRAVSVRVVG